MLLLGPLPLAFCCPGVGSQWITGEQRHLVTNSERQRGLGLSSRGLTMVLQQISHGCMQTTLHASRGN